MKKEEYMCRFREGVRAVSVRTLKEPACRSCAKGFGRERVD